MSEKTCEVLEKLFKISSRWMFIISANQPQLRADASAGVCWRSLLRATEKLKEKSSFKLFIPVSQQRRPDLRSVRRDLFFSKRRKLQERFKKAVKRWLRGRDNVFNEH